MKAVQQEPTLYRPATYQIKVPGRLDESWSDWVGGMTITVESGDDGLPTTTLIGVVADQGALQSMLRRLYSLARDTASSCFQGHSRPFSMHWPPV